MQPSITDGVFQMLLLGLRTKTKGTSPEVAVSYEGATFTAAWSPSCRADEPERRADDLLDRLVAPSERTTSLSNACSVQHKVGFLLTLSSSAYVNVHSALQLGSYTMPHQLIDENIKPRGERCLTSSSFTYIHST